MPPLPDDPRHLRAVSDAAADEARVREQRQAVIVAGPSYVDPCIRNIDLRDTKALDKAIAACPGHHFVAGLIVDGPEPPDAPRSEPTHPHVATAHGLSAALVAAGVDAQVSYRHDTGLIVVRLSPEKAERLREVLGR